MALEAPTRIVRCPDCGESHTLDSAFTGRETPCPGCGRLLRLDPQAVTPAPEEPSSRETTADLGTLRPEAAEHAHAAVRRPRPATPPPQVPVAAKSPLPGTADTAEAAAAPDALLDTVLGKCHLQRRLGEGGMGTVYLARHLTLDVEVAVKVLPAALAQRDRAFVDRFLREARTAARVHHPNIAQVFDVDFQKGLYFIVMEYVDGESAGLRLRRKRVLSERETVEIGLGVAAALEYARRKAIVHRDVKPENILLAREGEVKLADLGLAKRVSGEGGSDLTLRDQALGTPFYISPEQATNARAADHRSDLYSLGATLFHLVTGRPPFEGTSAFHTMTMHLNVPAPELRAFRADLSLELAALVQRLMRKNPAERFQTAGEVYAALHALYERLTPEAERGAALSGTVFLSREGLGTPVGTGTAPQATPAKSPAFLAPSGAPAAPPTPAAPYGDSEAHWPFALRAEISPPRSAPPPPSVPPADPGKVVVVYPVHRPSRLWLGFLLVPFLNGLAYLWVGTVAKKREWFYGGLGILVLTLVLGYFGYVLNETPAWIAFGLAYLVALVHGFAIRREYEFRAMEAARAAEEDLRRQLVREGGARAGEGE